MLKNCPDCKTQRKEYGSMYCPACYNTGGKEKDDKKAIKTLQAAYLKDFNKPMPQHLIDMYINDVLNK